MVEVVTFFVVEFADQLAVLQHQVLHFGRDEALKVRHESRQRVIYSFLTQKVFRIQINPVYGGVERMADGIQIIFGGIKCNLIKLGTYTTANFKLLYFLVQF